MVGGCPPSLQMMNKCRAAVAILRQLPAVAGNQSIASAKLELRTKPALFTLACMVPFLCRASSIHVWRGSWLSYIMASDSTGLSNCRRPTVYDARQMPSPRSLFTVCATHRCRQFTCIRLAPPGAITGYGLTPPSTLPLWCLCQNTTDNDRVLKSCHRNNTACNDKPTHQILSSCLHPLWKYDRHREMSKMWWFWMVRVTQSHWK